MKQHPIEPSAKLFKIELVQDAKEFDIIINKEKQIDREQAEQSAHTEEMLKGKYMAFSVGESDMQKTGGNPI